MHTVNPFEFNPFSAKHSVGVYILNPTVQMLLLCFDQMYEIMFMIELRTGGEAIARFCQLQRKTCQPYLSPNSCLLPGVFFPPLITKA